MTSGNPFDRRRPSPRRTQVNVYRVSDLDEFDLRELSDHENLAFAFRYMRAYGGHGGGADGATYGDFDGARIYQLCRALRDQVRGGEYRPGPRRRVRFPKQNGNGFRELSIPTVADRVVSGALQLATEIWQRNNFDCIHRSIWTCYLELEHAVQTTDARLLVTDDIRNCFPSIRINELLNCIARYTSNPELLGLYELLIRGTEAPDRQAGVFQGSPESPGLVGMYLHDILDAVQDVLCREIPSRIRYADNLIHVFRNEYEADEDRSTTSDILSQHGLQLKGQERTDIRNNTDVEVLGLIPRLEGTRIRYQIPTGKYEQLEERFESCWDQRNPMKAARAVTRGWINHAAPVLVEQQAQRAVISQVLRCASRKSLSLGPRTRWEAEARRTLKAWRRFRRRHGEGSLVGSIGNCSNVVSCRDTPDAGEMPATSAVADDNIAPWEPHS